MKFLAGFLIGILIGHFIGWSRAHMTIAAECERLGGFFVGKRIFECKRKNHD